MALCLCLLTSCTVGSGYTPPKNEVSDQWAALSGEEQPTDDASQDMDDERPAVTVSKDAVPSGPWWERFDDATLSALIKKALANNNDLKVAQARIAEARADEHVANAGLYPEIDATGSVSRATIDSISSSKPDTITQGGISANWDIDLFGAIRRRREAATANMEASADDFDQARLNLLADVARNYSHLRAAQMQRELTLRNLHIQRDTLHVTEALRHAQDVTNLDVARVRAQIGTTEARLPQIRSDIRAAMNRLSVLSGEQPGSLRKLLTQPLPMLGTPEKLVVLTPINAIAQRPDVHAAERHLAQASALSDAAFAGLFPDLSLSTFFGARNSNLYGSLSPWSATANAMFPLLDFGRLRAQMHSADARQEQAFHTYRQTVLLALEETENALDAYLDERARSRLLEDVAREQANAVKSAREQYRAGIVTQLDLLDAERNQLDAESALVLSRQTAADNLIVLYRSLGNAETQDAPVGGPVLAPVKTPASPAAKAADRSDMPPQADSQAIAAPVVPVTISTKPAPAMDAPDSTYSVYMGRFSKEKNAFELANKIAGTSPVSVDRMGRKWLVRAGPFKEKSEADAALKKLREDVPDAYIVRL